MYANRPRTSASPVTDQPKSKPSQLLTPDDVAELISVGRVTVIRLARAGRIPSLKVGKAVRFRPATIERWLQEAESGR